MSSYTIQHLLDLESSQASTSRAREDAAAVLPPVAAPLTLSPAVLVNPATGLLAAGSSQSGSHHHLQLHSEATGMVAVATAAVDNSSNQQQVQYAAVATNKKRSREPEPEQSTSEEQSERELLFLFFCSALIALKSLNCPVIIIIGSV